MIILLLLIQNSLSNRDNDNRDSSDDDYVQLYAIKTSSMKQLLKFITYGEDDSDRDRDSDDI